MQTNSRLQEIVYGALLTAIAILIPVAFGGYLRIYIPPFSATLASHLPVFISMLISPFAAVFVGFGSALGFFLIMGPVIGARAAVHILVGGTGAYLIKKGFGFGWALVAVAPIHALGEALIVVPFGFSLYEAGVLVGIGTLLHHMMDGFLAYVVVRSLQKTSSVLS